MVRSPTNGMIDKAGCSEDSVASRRTESCSVEGARKIGLGSQQHKDTSNDQ
jgi:hypothetical protein